MEGVTKAISRDQSTARHCLYMVMIRYCGYSSLEVGDQPGSLRKAQHRMLSEVKKHPGVTAQVTVDSLEQVHISPHEPATRKRLSRHCTPGRTPAKKPVLSRQNITARPKSDESHSDAPPQCLHCGGRTIIRACFAASRPGLWYIIIIH